MNVRLGSVVVAAVLVICVTLTLHGLSQMTLTSESVVPLRFAIVSLAVIVLVSRILRRSPWMIGIATSGVIALASGMFWPFLVVLWFAVASVLLGNSVLRWLGTDSDHPTVGLLVGAGVYGTSVGLLAHFSMNYPGVYAAALVLPLVAQYRTLGQWIDLIWQWRSVTRRLDPLDVRALDIAIVVVALVHFVVALMPEVGHDALAMHLFVPAHLSQRHEWGFDAGTYVWAVMPMLGDWIFSIGYMLAGETAARLINVGFIFVLALLIRDMVIWAGGEALGWRWAVLLFLSTPLTFTESSSLYIESIWACFVVAGSLAVFKSIDPNGERSAQFRSGGLLLGNALAAKAVTVTVLPALLIVLVFRGRGWLRTSSVRHLALGGSLLLMTGAIPYVTAWCLTGNPVFPFFNDVFQSPLYPPDRFSDERFGSGISWDVLYEATFRTARFLECASGAAGFQWLVLFVPGVLTLALGRRHKGILLCIVGGLSVVVAFQFTAYLRYVFPSFAWVAAGIGVAASALASVSTNTRRLVSIVCLGVVGLNLAYFRSGTAYGDLSLQPLTSAAGRETYLASRIPIRAAVELINRLNVGQTPVAVFSIPLTAPLNADALYPSWYNYRFQRLVAQTSSSSAMATLLAAEGVDYVILDDRWGTADQRAMIEGATEKVLSFGATSVRSQRSETRFRTELLKNTDFSTDEGWALSPGTQIAEDGGVMVAATSRVRQTIPVLSGHRYLLSATTMCADGPAQGRLQVNWLDAKMHGIDTTVRLFDCSPSYTSDSTEVVAAVGASTAIVYALGQTDARIKVRTLSFRQ